MILVWVVGALVVARLHVLIVPNKQSPFCGFGTIPAVMDRTALAPMAYRVLFPIIHTTVVRMLSIDNTVRKHQLYEVMRATAMFMMLLAVEHGIGTHAALVFLVLLPITILYDYWDWVIEVTAVSCALSGDWRLSLVAGLLLALSRETYPITSMAFWLTTGDWRGALGILWVSTTVALAVKVVVGRRRLYCSRWMLRQNWEDLKRVFYYPFPLDGVTASVLISALMLVAVIEQGGSAWVGLLVVLLGWSMARITETRVFVVCLLWIAQL